MDPQTREPLNLQTLELTNYEVDTLLAYVYRSSEVAGLFEAARLLACSEQSRCWRMSIEVVRLLACSEQAYVYRTVRLLACSKQ